MTDRPRITIPFGGGIDRESGILGTDARSMAELFNVHMHNQRIEVRRGVGRAAEFDAGLLLLNVHPVRSRSMAAYLLYDEFVFTLHLWQSAADGSGATEVAVIPAAEVTGRSKYVLADIYDKLFIAHDEPDILLRQPTRYWDFATETMNTIKVPEITGALAKFRGVASHLAYMLGWGWGLGGAEDRPETLRISLPGEPTKFDPNHYFLVGLRGEPINGGGAIGREWAIKKTSHGHKLIGSNRANFDVLPVEDHVGLDRHDLGVSVNGVYYFWSTDGPRRESGGQSEDISAGLRLLDDPPPGFMATTTTLGFAAYDPTRKEVLFVFERWAYVFHLDTNPERWSYREYGVSFSCGAVLYESTTGALVVAPDAGYDFTLDPIGVIDEGPPDPGYDFTFDDVDGP